MTLVSIAGAAGMTGTNRSDVFLGFTLDNNVVFEVCGYGGGTCQQLITLMDYPASWFFLVATASYAESSTPNLTIYIHSHKIVPGIYDGSKAPWTSTLSTLTGGSATGVGDIARSATTFSGTAGGLLASSLYKEGVSEDYRGSLAEVCFFTVTHEPPRGADQCDT